jgi:hypothetical protein
LQSPQRFPPVLRSAGGFRPAVAGLLLRRPVCRFVDSRAVCTSRDFSKSPGRV